MSVAGVGTRRKTSTRADQCRQNSVPCRDPCAVNRSFSEQTETEAAAGRIDGVRRTGFAGALLICGCVRFFLLRVRAMFAGGD